MILASSTHKFHNLIFSISRKTLSFNKMFLVVPGLHLGPDLTGLVTTL